MKQNTCCKALLVLVLSLVTMLGLAVVSAAAVDANGDHVCDSTPCLVCDIAAKINALPDAANITVDNAAAVTEQIHAIDRVKMDLTDDQYDELLTVVATQHSGSGGLDEPARYMAAVEKVVSLSAGGSLYITKSYSVGSTQLDWAQTDATLTIESLDAGSTFAPLSVTLSDIANLSALADHGLYFATADGWTNCYILPAGTYKITETGYNAVTTSGEVLTTTASYSVNGNAVSTNYAEVTVENDGSSVVTVGNFYNPISYNLWVGGVEVTEQNAHDVLGDDTVSYDPVTNTLTLNSVTLTTTDAAIKANGDLNIALNDNNSITSTNDSGIEVTGAVTIVGGGTLRVSSTNGNGIEASDDINIADGTVSVTADDDHCGIVSLTSITIGGEDNPTVTVGCKVGLDAPIVTIKNSCTLTITSKECAIATAAPLNFPEGNWYQWTTVENDAMTLSREQACELDSNDSYLHIESAPLTYTVTFMNGNEEWASISVNAGDTVALKISGMPAPPAPAGYEFAGWYAGDEQIVPETVVNSDIVAEATWREKTSPPAYYPIYIPTEDEPTITSPNTFDSGIATSVVLTLLAATGTAWLGKKKD